MVQDVSYNFGNSFGRSQGPLSVNGINFFILDMIRQFHGVDEINPKGQDIAIIDRVNNGISVKLFAKDLFCCGKSRVTPQGRIGGENGGACKTKDMISLEMLNDGAVHLTKL